MISFISTVVNYEYAFYWSFYQVWAWAACAESLLLSPTSSNMHGCCTSHLSGPAW